jgi:hypothetical protein
MDHIVTIGRQIFADTSVSLAETSKQVAAIPSEEEEQALQSAGVDQGRMVSGKKLRKWNISLMLLTRASHAPNKRP